ncbi:unnamed protein product [Didymodactylos carnosus]|uniref:Macro domain-containing protein n=1 Tax=Didymodactylos carnosus TaxID=1234261 RepID=A0A814MBW2_9BILA|nr:unnamed protein product [Didymodactylos carnosus]CAF1075666.1 unnamed protein product [Didymodactylos carnosus]CAF3802945.1 unnamed protein product [Didymodactylos carnosus]CAF3842334.1 unnamed protein product [Didymodactylos carnosus]
MSAITIVRPNNISIQFKFNNSSLVVTMKQGDLSKEECDAIVNPTNNNMKPDGGLDNILHSVGGSFYSAQVMIMTKRFEEYSCPTGQSRIFLNDADNKTPFIINTVGPIYSAAECQKSALQLTSCYYTSLSLANLYGLASIAYSAISCGQHAYPTEQAAKIAFESVQKYAFNVSDIRFVLFDQHIYDTFVNEWCKLANEK